MDTLLEYIIVTAVVALVFLGLYRAAVVRKQKASEDEIERLHLEISEKREWWGLVCHSIASNDLGLLSRQLNSGELFEIQKLTEVLSECPSFFDYRFPDELRILTEILKKLPEEMQPVMPV